MMHGFPKFCFSEIHASFVFGGIRNLRTLRGVQDLQFVIPDAPRGLDWGRERKSFGVICVHWMSMKRVQLVNRWFL